MLRFSRTWPFLLAIVLVYLAPTAVGLMAGWGASPQTSDAIARALWASLALLLYPIAVMVTGFFAGLTWGKVWLVPVLAAVLSVPFSLLFLGTTAAALVAALVYFAIYLGFGVVGWFLGYQVHLRREAARAEAGPPAQP